PDLFQALFIRVSDQGVDMDAARRGGDKLMFDLQPVQAVENDLDPLFRSSDSFEKRLNAVAWLNDYLHLSLSPESLHQLTHREAGPAPASPSLVDFNAQRLCSQKDRFGPLPDNGLEFADAFANLRREAIGFGLCRAGGAESVVDLFVTQLTEDAGKPSS